MRGFIFEVNIKEAYYKPQPIYTDTPGVITDTFQGVDLF